MGPACFWITEHLTAPASFLVALTKAEDRVIELKSGQRFFNFKLYRTEVGKITTQAEQTMPPIFCSSSTLGAYVLDFKVKGGNA